MSAGEDKLRIEVLVAGPPTSKCKQVIGMMEKVVMENPGQVKLDIYYAGTQLMVKPTRGYQDEGKMKKIPSIFVNGIQVSGLEIPREEELRSEVERELRRGAAFWEK
jgi:hypothetical protein